MPSGSRQRHLHLYAVFSAQGIKNKYTFDASDLITSEERQQLYKLIIQCEWSNGMYGPVLRWLDQLDAKRASLKSPSFIDEL